MQTENFINKHRRIILAIFVIVVLLLIFYLIFLLSGLVAKNNPSKTIILDNESQYTSSVKATVLESAAQRTYQYLTSSVSNPADTYHGNISALKTTDDNIGQSVSFVINVSSVNLSWNIGLEVDKSGDLYSEIAVNCVSDSNGCVGSNTNQQKLTPDQTIYYDLARQLPIETSQYKITAGYVSSTDYTPAIIITEYQSGGHQAALQAITNLGFDTSKFNIIYN